MIKYIEKFPEQILEAIEVSSRIKLKNLAGKSFDNIVICGLGGSGIGGTIVKNYAFDKVSVPIEVVKDYTLPHFVTGRSLIVLSSYSGNTEETIACFNQALAVSGNLFVITSGGQLKALAEAHRIDHIVIPEGYPPRAALGYSLTQLLVLFSTLGVIEEDVEEQILKARANILHYMEDIKKIAQELAVSLASHFPIIYAESGMEGVAVRWRQQINENAKMLCSHHVVPEMNHNELVGWKILPEQSFIIILRHSFENQRNQLRFAFIKEILKECGILSEEIIAKGNSYLEQVFYLISIGDWLSYYLSEIKGVDSLEISVIDKLKKALG